MENFWAMIMNKKLLKLSKLERILGEAMKIEYRKLEVKSVYDLARLPPPLLQLKFPSHRWSEVQMDELLYKCILLTSKKNLNFSREMNRKISWMDEKRDKNLETFYLGLSFKKKFRLHANFLNSALYVFHVKRKMGKSCSRKYFFHYHNCEKSCVTQRTTFVGLRTCRFYL